MKSKPNAAPRKGEASARPSTILKLIRLDELRLDGNTQTREDTNEEAVGDYAVLMAEKGNNFFPPIAVFIDAEGNKWLADGFHRVHAAKRNNLQTIKAQVYQGSRVDALLHNLEANKIHGVRRTQADKRRSIELVLMEKSLCKRSSRSIANLCGVGHQLVEKVRRQQTIAQVDESSTSPETAVRIGDDGKAHPIRHTKRTGKPKVKAEPVTAIGTSEQTDDEAATDSNIDSSAPEQVPPAADAENVDDGTPAEADSEPDKPLKVVVLDTHDDEETNTPIRENSAEHPNLATPAPEGRLDMLLSTDFDQYWNEHSPGRKEVDGWLSSAHDKLPLEHYTQQEKEAFDECFIEQAQGVIGLGEDVCPEHQAGAHVSARAAIVLGVILSEYVASRNG